MTDKPNDKKKSIAKEKEEYNQMNRHIKKVLKTMHDLTGKNDDYSKKRLPTETVYRIMKLEHLISDIKNEVITFTHPSCFDDVTESKDEDALFVQCWTRASETPAMWEVFAPDKQGIMIKFNPQKTIGNDKHIVKVFGKNILFQPFQCNHDWRNMEYDYKPSEKERDEKNPEDPLERLFHKREAYKYEEESRWVVDLRNHSWFPSCRNVGGQYEKFPKIISDYTNGCYKRFLQLPFSNYQWSLLISEIIIDPRADEDFFRYATDLLKATIIKHDLIIKQSTFWGNGEELSKEKYEEKQKKQNSSEILQLYYYSEGRKDLIMHNLEISNREENLQLYLLVLHDLLLFDNISKIDNDILIAEKEMIILLKEENKSFLLYLTSYSILVAMDIIRKTTIFNKELDDDNSKRAFQSVKQMFFLINKFLFDSHLGNGYQDDDFINEIISFWINQGSDTSKVYFNKWTKAYLELPINNSSTEFDYLKNSTAIVDYSLIKQCLEIQKFHNTIIKPYFDSLKNHN